MSSPGFETVSGVFIRPGQESKCIQQAEASSKPVMFAKDKCLQINDNCKSEAGEDLGEKKL